MDQGGQVRAALDPSLLPSVPGQPGAAGAVRAGLQSASGGLALPRSVRHWSLRSLQAKLIKIGAKVVTHSRRIIFQMAEVAVPKMLFEAILKRIGELAPVTE